MSRNNNRKRRGKKEGSVYQMPNGKWRAQISVQGLNGKRRRVTRTGKTKEHAILLLSELQAERPSFVSAGEVVRLSDYLEAWLSNQVKKKAEATFCSFRAAVKNHINPHLGNILLTDLSEEHINLWIEELVTSKVGSATQKKAYKVLRAAIIHACKRRLIDRDPMQFCSCPKDAREPIYPFTASETKQILKQVVGDKYEAVYHLGLKSGLRQQEIFGLQWQDVDFTGRRISIRRVVSEVEGRLIVKEPKTAKSKRNVSLPQTTIDVIQNMQQGKRKDPVFVSHDGGLIRRSNFSHRHWAKVLRKLGLEHRGFHHCRHTAATLMLRAGVPIHVVSGQLGHSSPSITLDIYAHYILDDHAQASHAIEAAINNG